MSRPEKPINWELVDELLIAGCMGTEIAPHFDMHQNTFYDRVVEKYGMSFTEYSTQKKAQGEACIRKKQFDKALDGDTTLLIWLGKVRCDQKEHKENDGLTEQNQKLDSIFGMMKNMQEKKEEK